MNPEKRFWEIDALRGTAIILMVLFHVAFDLSYFGNYNLALHSGPLFYLGRASASIFILLAGISLSLSHSRNKAPFRKYLRRGLKILSWGLLITAITYLLFPAEFILFGILHFIGISIILSYPFLSYRYGNLILGLSAILLGTLRGPFPIFPASIRTFDYFPLLPWFGLILLGIFLGSTLYSGHRRKFTIPEISTPLSLLGRYSPLIYLLHQPVLLAILYLFGIV